MTAMASVDLPQPDSPTTPTISPWSTVSETSVTADTTSSSTAKATPSPSMLSTRSLIEPCPAGRAAG